MHSLRMLGGISLSDADGREVEALLRQPKHIALLAFVAMPRPGTWHRRDSLLATFWPELDGDRARRALRSALHTLRSHLPDGAIRSRGDSEISLDPDILQTDVAGMSDDLRAGRAEEALASYGGEFLPALHIADAEEFEKWLGQQRQRIKTDAQKVATILSESRAASGDLVGATDAARRAAEIDPDDEVAVRRWIALLDRSGDRSQAFAVYERFRDHAMREFGVRPSAETVALVDAVRTRRDATVLAPDVPAPQAKVEDGPLVPARAAERIKPRRPRSDLWWILGATTVVAAIALLASSKDEPKPASNQPATSRRLVVLPMENETKDAGRGYIASGLAEGIARRLEGMGGMTIRSGARSPWPDSVRKDFKMIGRQFGSTLLLKTRLTATDDDALQVDVSVIDAATLDEKRIPPRRFRIAELRDVESEIAAAVAGEIFRVPVPTLPRGRVDEIDPESYRLVLEGWHHLVITRNNAEAKRLFEEAINVDPSNSRAWSGLSSIWASDASSERIPFDEAFTRASAAAERAISLDSLDGTAWANLGVLRAWRRRNLAIGTELIRKAIAADPGNPEVHVIASHLYRSAWQWDKSRDAIRMSRRLDPLNPLHMEREATLELCAGRPDVALRILQQELLANPSNKAALEGRIRALARAGRYDEAIAAWRDLATTNRDSLVVRALAPARGMTGYWNVKWLVGRRDNPAPVTGPTAGETGTVRNARFFFSTGRIDEGFRELDRLEKEKNVVLFRLPCLPMLDVVRGTPRYDSMVRRIGPMPTG